MDDNGTSGKGIAPVRANGLTGVISPASFALFVVDGNSEVLGQGRRLAGLVRIKGRFMDMTTPIYLDEADWHGNTDLTIVDTLVLGGQLPRRCLGLLQESSTHFGESAGE